MKLLMAVSADGYVANGPDDDMKWTGPIDKAVFRLLTMGQVLGAGRTTYNLMRNLKLPHRDLRLITSNPGMGFTLESFVRCCPDAWLIGGPTTAVAALEMGILDKVYLSVVGVGLGGGIKLDHRIREFGVLLDKIALFGVPHTHVEVRRNA